MRKSIMLLAILAMAIPANAKGIKVGKALRHTAAMVSAPVRHPMVTAKLSVTGVFTGIVSGVEAVGVVFETVGLGVEKAGTLVYDLGEVLSGYGKPSPTPAPPAPASKP